MFEKILPFTGKRHVAGLKCAFTGHRPQNLPFRFDETDERCLRLKAELRKLIVQMIEQKMSHTLFRAWLLELIHTLLR